MSNIVKYEAHCTQCEEIIKFSLFENKKIAVGALAKVEHGKNCEGFCLICIEE